MNRYGVLASDSKTILGFVKAQNFTEAQNLVKNKVSLIDPDFLLKEFTVGFSDQFIVEEISFTVNNNYDPKTAIVLQQMLYIFDEWTGTRLVSQTKDYTKIPVYGFDFGVQGSTPKSFIEHERNLPSLLSLGALGSQKEERHWYWTGWVYYYNNIKYYRVWNAITRKIGFVKAGQDFYFQRTALETNFGTFQKNLNDLEKSIQTNIITPVKESLNYLEKVGYVFVLVGSLYLLSKSNK